MPKDPGKKSQSVSSLNLSRSQLSPTIISGGAMNQSLSLLSMSLSTYSTSDRSLGPFSGRKVPNTLPPLSSKDRALPQSPVADRTKAVATSEFSFQDIRSARGTNRFSHASTDVAGMSVSQSMPLLSTGRKPKTASFQHLGPDDFGIREMQEPSLSTSNFGPMRGKCLSRSVLSRPDLISLSRAHSYNNLEMQPSSPSGSMSELPSPNLLPITIDLSAQSGGNMLGGLRVGIPDDISTSESAALSPPRNLGALDPPVVPFDDDEVAVPPEDAQGEIAGKDVSVSPEESHASPVQIQQRAMQHVSLDISESSLATGSAFPTPSVHQPGALHPNPVLPRRKQMLDFPVKRAPLVGTSGHNRTIGAKQLAPFNPHQRILGWKLTSVTRRKHMIDVLDAVHGQVHPSQFKQIRRQIQHEMKSGSLTDQSAFVPKELSQHQVQQGSSSLLLDEYLQSQTLSQSAKARETLAWEEFVSRMTRSRQGYNSVQQIHEMMCSRQRRQAVQKEFIAQSHQRGASPPSHAQHGSQSLAASSLASEFGFADSSVYDPRTSGFGSRGANPVGSANGSRPQSSNRAMSAHPYMNVGTLASTDHLADHEHSQSLRALLIESLFGPDDEDELDIPYGGASNPRSQGMPGGGERSKTPKDMYDFPLSIHRPRSRLDIHEVVQMRQGLEPVLRQESSWKEDQLVDAFIAGRQNARLRKSRERDNASHNSRSMSPEFNQPASHTGNSLLGEGWDDESLMSVSTSAEENEAALSEALMENFGLSLHDDEEDAEGLGGLGEGYSRELKGDSAVFSEVEASSLAPPSVHPLQPTSPANSFRYSPQAAHTIGMEGDMTWDDNSSRGSNTSRSSRRR